MKIMFSCIHFPIWLYLPKIMKKTVFYTGKLYGLTGMTQNTHIFRVSPLFKQQTDNTLTNDEWKWPTYLVLVRA